VLNCKSGNVENFQSRFSQNRVFGDRPLQFQRAQIFIKIRIRSDEQTDKRRAKNIASLSEFIKISS